ncbi:MAG: translation initiation factor IF-2 [Pseudomonadales bacterium]|jgi:translation initiation factor IF-2|nr:translation initiation factor IF-2 [Pseudomonadales bacterium]
MAEVTVKQLAETVGAPADRLLKQMREAGLPQESLDESVTEEQKQTLLAYLKGVHGEATSAQPRKITLKRKTVSTLRADRGRGKAVAVEVRKKRTYVKRDGAAGSAAPAESAESELARLKAEEAQLEAERQKAELERRAEEERRREEAAKRTEEQEAAALQEQAKTAVDAEEEARKQREEDERARQEAAAAIAAAEATTAKTEKRGGKAPPKKKDKEEEERLRRSRKLDAEDQAIEARTRRAGTISRERLAQRKRRSSRGMPRTQGFERPTETITREVDIPEAISVGDLAQRMSVKASDAIKRLMSMGVMATINQVLDQDTAVLLVEEFGHKPKLVASDAIEQEYFESLKVEGEEHPRPAVVTVMGHVDHGKTSLLDYIRKTRVASGEAGGITQHIGAYHVDTGHGVITFLDTPGHAAFTAMRARGAQVTDIVVLVVAADDGVMPQTLEAVQHAKAAGVPIVVAVNKIDKEGADPQRVRSELAAKDVVPEDWGGDTQFVHVSALSGEGIDALLEALVLQAELLELKAVPDSPGQGTVIESRLDRGRGPVATLLVRNGTLRKGDYVVAGEYVGRVRAMLDETGAQITEAEPSIPVEVLGLAGTPDAGDDFSVVEDERRARELVDFRRERSQEARMKQQRATRLDSLFDGMGEGEVRTLNIVLKADVRGSLEALTHAINEITTDEVRANLVSTGVGGINESDANLALASKALVIGFNVRADAAAKKIIENDGLDLRYYSIIYELLDDIRQMLSGMLAPEIREEIVGVAEVRDVFRSPKLGAIAGCMVIDGTVYRNKKIRVLRDDVVIYEGELESLRRFKDDVQEVRQGTECGIGVKNYNDVREGDKIEVFDTKEVARTL